MKTYMRMGLLTWIVIFFTAACSYLDVVPDETPEEKDAFQNPTMAERYLYSCYSFLPDPRHETASLDLLTADEVVTPWEHETFANFPKGNYNASDPVISYWNTLFGGIRRCYLLLENIDGVPNMTEANLRTYKGEAKFLIAYYHFLLLKNYGPIPLIKGVLPIDMDKADFPERESYDVCVEWISDLFDEASTLLPAEQTSTADGRATSVAAKALKSRLWLYAASQAAGKRGSKFTLIKEMDTSEKECLLYLPNYSELLSLQIGVDEGASITPLENPFRHKIVIFGSSFTHGVSTSRAGMSYPMQIERNTGLYFCSIACSGNCKLQPYFADYLGDVKDADAMVFDGFSNPDAKMIRERLIPFIARIREKLPTTPLIFVQTIYRESCNFNLAVRAREEAKQAAAREMMAQAMREFDGVYFIDKANLTGTDHATSADGTHPSDLGYWRWAQNLQPELLKVLRKCGIR